MTTHTQPQRTKSDADESWEVKAEKGKVDAPPAGAAAAAAAAGGATPFANKDGSPAAPAAAAAPALADDGRRRYTADFMKTLREANREHPGDMLQGEFEGKPPMEMPGAGSYGPGGFDRGISRR